SLAFHGLTAHLHAPSTSALSLCFSYGYGAPRPLHSFPTRRSSDLAGPAVTTGPIVARRGSRRRRVGTRTPPRGGRLGGARTQRRPPVGGQRARLLGPGPGPLGPRQPQAQPGEPHEEGAEHGEAGQPG